MFFQTEDLFVWKGENLIGVMILDVAMGITGRIIYEKTGKLCRTIYRKREKRITAEEAKLLQSQGWNFDWSKPEKEGNSVFELRTICDGKLQGMIAIKHNAKSLFTEVNLVESAPENIGTRGIYEGVGGNLFAIACMESFNEGFDGCISFVAKTKLIEYYMKAFNATHIGGQKLSIEDEAAKNLVKKYLNKDVIQMSDKNKLKEAKFEYLDANLLDFDKAFSDGRLVEPWDPNEPDYDLRAAVREVKRLGRPLTEEELKKFIIQE